jgi:hypothetical protein
MRPLETGGRWCSFCGEPVPAIIGATQPLPDSYEAPATAAPVVVQAAEPLAVGGAAIASLVFGILGLLGPLYLIGPLLALGFARRARREAAAGVVAGAEMARAARILAWTALIILLIAGLVVVGLVTVRYEPGVGFRLR